MLSKYLQAYKLIYQSSHHEASQHFTHVRVVVSLQKVTRGMWQNSWPPT